MLVPVFTKARKRFGVEYPSELTEYQVELANGAISIFKKGVFQTAFKVGDRAEYGSYNLSYYGEIIKITDKTVTIKEQHGWGKVHRLSLHEFCWRNESFDVGEASAKNNETMMYI